jgi:hypothetical protein
MLVITARMKTFLGYLTFAALLALCYIEKINAEAAKNEARGHAVGHHAPGWEGERPAVAQLRE